MTRVRGDYQAYFEKLSIPLTSFYPCFNASDGLTSFASNDILTYLKRARPLSVLATITKLSYDKRTDTVQDLMQK